MSPDINSLPPSRSASASPRQPRNLSALSDTLSQQTPSLSGISSAAVANMNINNHSHTGTSELPRRPHIPIPGSERRRSSNLNLSNNGNNEPVIGDAPLSSSDHRSSLSHGLRTSSPSSIGGSPVVATGDPHHQRAPSLGELHQELEQEQEAQVNRLLQTIRAQQTQLQHLQQQQQQPSAVDDTTPAERSTAFPPIVPLSTVSNRASTQLPSSLSSRRPSQTHSPTLRPLPDSSRGPDTPEWVTGPGETVARRGSRDESGYYQAEAAMLARENQMLQQRIRELERQVSELTTSHAAQGSVAQSHPSQGAQSDNLTNLPTTTGVESATEPSDKT